MKILNTFLIILLVDLPIFGQIINIPTDYPAIQDGINAANEGDTVLVARGTYLENIRFKGKAITLGSHFLNDGDTSHISKTIIDGSQPTDPDSASTVIFGDGEDSTTVLCGFTITGGRGTMHNNPMSGLYRSGGGIFIGEESGGTIEYNTIRNNHIFSDNKIWGGGMFIMLGGDTGIVKTIIVQYNEIRNNSITSSSSGGSSGGGIKVGVGKRVEHGRIILQNNLISHNEVINTTNGNAFGGGMNFGMVLPTAPGDYIIRNNVFSYNRVSGSAWIVAGGFSIIHILESTEEFYDSVPAPKVYNNIVSNNYSTGYAAGVVIYTNYKVNKTINSVPQPVLANNTIVDNISLSPVGIYGYRSRPVFINNIVWNDLETYNANELYYTGDFHAHHNNIQGINPVGTNISKKPFFKPGSYLLDTCSPCIGTGILSIEIEGCLYHAPTVDINGNPRPYPLDGLVDMGVIESEYPKADCPTGTNELSDLDNPISVYPNPFSINIKVELGKNKPIQKIEILNLDGRVIQVLDQIQENPVTINRGSLTAGLYLLRVHSVNVYTEKIIVK